MDQLKVETFPVVPSSAAGWNSERTGLGYAPSLSTVADTQSSVSTNSTLSFFPTTSHFLLLVHDESPTGSFCRSTEPRCIPQYYYRRDYNTSCRGPGSSRTILRRERTVLR